MSGNVLPVLVLTACVSTLGGAAAAYQGSPKGKKWKFVIPIVVLIVFLFVAAGVLASLTISKQLDVETGRMILMGLCALITAFNIYFFLKHR